MRKFLVDGCVTLCVYQRHCTLYTVSSTIFFEGAENRIKIELVICFVNGTIFRTQHCEHQQPVPLEMCTTRRKRRDVAHNVAMRLKDAEQKLSGDLAQYW